MTVILESSIPMLCGRHHLLVDGYVVSISQMQSNMNVVTCGAANATLSEEDIGSILIGLVMLYFIGVCYSLSFFVIVSLATCMSFYIDL